MIKLEIDNSYSRITGLTLKQEQELKNLMSYTLPQNNSYFSGRYGPQTRTLLGRRGDFPTGLLYIIFDYFRGNPSVTTTATIIDNRKRPKAAEKSLSIDLEFNPYPEQIAAAIAAAREERGIICAPTGIGKSVIAALIIFELKVPTLVVVPTLNLKVQLINAFKEMFKNVSVGPISKKPFIAVENVDALPIKQELKGYNAVIIDEFHHSASKTYRDLNKHTWGNIYYKFGLTATPFRSQDHERLLLESVLSKVIYKIDYQKAIEKDYIVPVEAYYYTLPKQQVVGNTRSWPAVYSELVVNNFTRNSLISQIITKLSDNSTICLVKEIEHGLKLSNDGKIPFVNGISATNRMDLLQFLLGYSKTIIGTTGVLGEGVDTKPAEFIIIAGLGKSKNAFMQQVGRGLRKYKDKKSCKIILFKDPSHKWTLNHFKEQCKILKEEYNVVPIELDLPESI